MKNSFIIVVVFLQVVIFTNTAHAQSTEKLYLSGRDKDHTLPWEFKVSGGRNSGNWTNIPVPSNWEMQGFGTYRYWNDWSHEPVPDSIGYYRHKFTIPKEWKNKKINIVFEAVMTDTYLKINGKLLGLIHQGGFYEFRYDLSGFLNYDKENLLEVEVHRYSSNKSINMAERNSDFWLFSGIFRPVWLEALPNEHIERMALNARHTGDFSVDVYVAGISSADQITAGIRELDGAPVGADFSALIKKGQAVATLNTVAKNIKPWSAEWPHRYNVVINLLSKRKVIHSVTQKFGFRTIEVRERDGVYVNDHKVRLKGSNRHSFWPVSGRTTSKEISILDVNLMKDMNMNAVRMSHYPPEKHFLEVTDSLGLYVLDELTGWQNKYDTKAGEKLVRELIIRDVNHPSIIFWDNGNEGGWNVDLDDDFTKWDPQKRVVLHPWENFNGINTAHYEMYNCCTGDFFNGKDLFMPTEFLHGLYDGGHGAGLDDWWSLMMKKPLAVGGFLWAYADEGIVRSDQHDAIDVAGNRAPDGIVGPYREKEASFFTIKEIWSPVYLPLSEQERIPASFNGILSIENRYYHTNLRDVKFQWKVVDFAMPGIKKEFTEISSGAANGPDVEPGLTGILSFDLPKDLFKHDALFLTATDLAGREIYTWTWMIPSPADVANRNIHPSKEKASAVEHSGEIELKGGTTSVTIDKASGQIKNIISNGKKISLTNGPRILSGDATVKSVRHFQENNDHVIEVLLEGNMKKIIWRMLPDGWLKLNYAYQYPGHSRLDYIGVTFDYPEGEVEGFRWLGKGPYRVWKNRTKGTEYNVWEKKYNNTVTGLSWEYPEFKGFHANIYWATIQTKEAPITIMFESEDLYLRLLTPKEAEGKDFDPRTTHVNFPAGDISFLHGIAPIGTKFHAAAEESPAGDQNFVRRLGKWYEVTVDFYFGM